MKIITVLTNTILVVSIAGLTTSCGWLDSLNKVSVNKDTSFVSHKISGSNTTDNKVRFVTTGAQNLTLPTVLPAQIVEITDGDTFLVTNKDINQALDTSTKKTGDVVYTLKVRMLYSDTPETKKPKVEPQCYGQQASDWTKKQLDSKDVFLAFDAGPVDVKYQRVLGFVFENKQDAVDYQNTKSDESITKSLNYKIVSTGRGRVTAYSPNTKYRKIFQAAEAAAKQKKLGAWACPKPFEQ